MDLDPELDNILKRRRRRRTERFMTTNPAQYFQLCGRENSIDILPDTLTSYNVEDSNKFKTLVVFDCRGLEPVDFSPRNGWRVSFSPFIVKTLT